MVNKVKAVVKHPGHVVRYGGFRGWIFKFSRLCSYRITSIVDSTTENTSDSRSAVPENDLRR
ncbi:hypothetical protein TOT_010000873 [Theileria orientalis strain Shintoku]|uniref:Uncharacterized protein n=1 Tax=Theileria orientalis strain Shintoku TaxID=869250 RepID=J4CCH8_THEOR|nr:hypothetical protein TOT_010000873 [Theileria orientalis strain Shintoku]BAM39417.1 hypothetical protein TOT_010000873 [Theileria orientalis strain Shintoku]|eukprot:XP_009689718.1 hypothetical protein TOT_010000873 [Theileria orientalis strain Shintoku]